jgi:hypothetical protein
VNVKFTDEIQGKAIIEVINQLGQVVKTSEITINGQESVFRLDVSDLNNGMYFLVAHNNNTTATTRIIINR